MATRSQVDPGTIESSKTRFFDKAIAKSRKQPGQQRARVVISGMGAISPLGRSAPDTWAGLIARRSGISLYQHAQAIDLPIKIMAEVQNFDPHLYMDPKQARRMARFSQLAVAASREAMLDACLIEVADPLETPIRSVDPERVGVIIGTCAGGYNEVRDATQVLLERGYTRVSPFFLVTMMSNAPAANINRQYGLLRFNSTTSTACAAAAQAIGEAAEVIQRGVADIMVAGGTESSHGDLGVAGFHAMRAMSTKFDEPERASKPFDLECDGLVGGEGAAILILERLEHAQARGVRIFAEVLGFGCSADGGHLASPAPHSQARAMCWALGDAQIGPSDVEYVSAHATSTPVGDAVEAQAIHLVFGDRAKRIPVSAAKSMTGHIIGESGALEAMSCAMTIHDGIIRPTINYHTPDPVCDLDVVPNTARRQRVQIALSNSFGMGGQNVSLVYGEI